MCLYTLFIPDFEESSFQMFLSHHMSILLFILDFNKVECDEKYLKITLFEIREKS